MAKYGETAKKEVKKVLIQKKRNKLSLSIFCKIDCICKKRILKSYFSGFCAMI